MHGLEDSPSNKERLVPEPTTKKWRGEAPTKCAICRNSFGKVFYDANTRMGWGLVCHGCFTDYGYGLGIGLGQKYNTSTLERVSS
jgi:hypothetical protein